MAELYQYDTVPSPDLLIKCFEWGHNILDEYGNNSYNSLKMWEPFLTGYLINFHTYENVNTKGFLDLMRKEFFKSQGPENSERLENHLTNIIPQILQYIALNLHVLNQLFGLYWNWGHPTISGKDGIRISKEIVINQHITHYEAVAIISRQ